MVVLVDDGIAMGSTMRAAIMLCKNKKAKKSSWQYQFQEKMLQKR